MECIDYMSEKFRRSGYSDEELTICREKALGLKRCDILQKTQDKDDETTKSEENILTFVINHDPDMAKYLKSFFRDNSGTIKQLIGECKIIISERKNPNIASLTFAKSSFSTVESTLSTHQKCGVRRCQTCPVMNLPRKITLNNIPVKLDFSLDCMSENCIYVAMCKFCNCEFYLGKTVNMVRTRFNGHRGCFKLENCKYTDSALSMHIAHLRCPS